MATVDARADRLARGFARFCERVVRVLPFGLDRVVAPTFVGFALIGGVTFGDDLVILWLLYRVLGLPIVVSATVGYAVAFGLAFLANRVFNFDSHGPLGQQAGLYAAAVGFSYVAFIVGLTGGLVAVGVDFRIARFAAAICEAAFMYSVMRYLVFRRSSGRSGGSSADGSGGSSADGSAADVSAAGGSADGQVDAAREA